MRDARSASTSAATRFDRLGAERVDFFLVLLPGRAAEFFELGRAHFDRSGRRFLFDRLRFLYFLGFGLRAFLARRGACGGGLGSRGCGGDARGGRAPSGGERRGGASAAE